MIDLRVVESADGDALHAIFTEPGVRRFLFDDLELTRVQTQEHVDAASAQGGWTIRRDGGIVGLVALRPVGADRELIVAVSERHWGSGAALQAARQAMRHGFECLGLARILATVDLPNERSHRLMARLGFAPTGEGDGPKYRFRRYEALRRSGT
ncbi:MAG: GNAT family N-acetyltransferase [Enhydrobacter sp.]|nr:GNAT family N-acetyltransferase [Enhydrobacter sp.]